jgi:hypothetical protein
MKKFLESTLFITIISVMLSGVLVSCREKKPLVLSTPVAESVEERKEESSVSEPVVEQPKTENETQAVKDEPAPKEEKSKEPRVSISKVDLKLFSPFDYAAENTGSYGPGNPMGTLYEYPEFCVVGWSKDGKVAIASCVAVEGRGGETATFYVQDLVSDEILWTESFDSEDAASTEGFFNYCIKTYAAKIDSVLEKYDIQLLNSKFLALPVESNGAKIEFAAIQKRTNDEEEFIPEMNYSIKATKNGASKTVVDKKSVQAYEIYLCGYMMSPMEDRAMLIYAERVMAFEGAGLRYHIAGCDLNKGFKK